MTSFSQKELAIGPESLLQVNAIALFSMKTVPNKKKAYARAGVDVDLGNSVKKTIQTQVRKTHGPEVLGRIGGFGGLFRPDFRGMKDPILVSSVDGVGTKLKLAFALDRHDTVAEDLVNHCVDDILVLGARPLFFLDYIGTERLEPRVFGELMKGFSRACRAAGCALIGGETAQLPGMYRPREYDLAGTIVGVVDRPHMIDGSRIRSGDVLIGLPSNGLHTNGYTLARKVLFERMKLRPDARVTGLKGTLGEELLRVHRNYLPVIDRLDRKVLKGLAHITGGGLVDNLPRILPENCDAVIDTAAWKVPELFQLIEVGGKIDREEMYQVFNMGIGMTLVVAEKDAQTVLKSTKGRRLGTIEKGTGRVRLEFA